MTSTNGVCACCGCCGCWFGDESGEIKGEEGGGCRVGVLLWCCGMCDENEGPVVDDDGT
jgi:hypothetical protein